MATTIIITFGLMLLQAALTAVLTGLVFALTIINQSKMAEKDHQKRVAEMERLRAIRDKAAKEADERMKLED